MKISRLENQVVDYGIAMESKSWYRFVKIG